MKQETLRENIHLISGAVTCISRRDAERAEKGGQLIDNFCRTHFERVRRDAEFVRDNLPLRLASQNAAEDAFGYFIGRTKSGYVFPGTGPF